MKNKAELHKVIPAFEGHAVKIILQTADSQKSSIVEPGYPTRQEFSLTSKGKLVIKKWEIGDTGRECQIEKIDTDIVPDIAEFILERFTSVFSAQKNHHQFGDDLSIGFEWKLEMVNEEGTSFKFVDSVALLPSDALSDLSFLIRRITFQSDLLLFDCDMSGDRIDSFVMEYTKERKDECYKEKLVIEREEHKLIATTENSGNGESFMMELKNNNLISDSLNFLSTNIQLWKTRKIPSDSMPSSKTYKIKARFDSGRIFSQSGFFTKDTLPEIWSGIATLIENLILKSRVFLEALDQDRIDLPLQRKGEKMYCTVMLHDSQKESTYLCEDESIDYDDVVMVPVGKSDKETEATVVDIQYYKDGQTPFKTEQIKKIIQRIDSID